MSDSGELLFESTDILVRKVEASRERERCYVTFDSYTDNRRLDRPGFGEHYFRRRGIDAVHVISRDNRWYQHPEFPEALARVRAATADYRQVLSYGSSMGGFAALQYGSACGAQIGVALSPQFTINGALPPHDRRWRAEAEQIDWLDFTAPPLALQFILFDPLDRLDRAHTALFAARSPTVPIRIPNAGHPVGSYVAETGMFGPLFAGVTAGFLSAATAPLFEAELRRRRGRSGQFYFTLALRAAAGGRLDRALTFAARAVAVQPQDAAYLSHLALLLDQAGRHDEAAARHAEALALNSDNVHLARNLVIHHVARGDLDRAQAMAGQLLTDYPDVPAVHDCLNLVRRKRWQATVPGRLARAIGAGALVNWAADRFAAEPSSEPVGG